jgi:hypothetical protein
MSAKKNAVAIIAGVVALMGVLYLHKDHDATDRVLAQRDYGVSRKAAIEPLKPKDVALPGSGTSFNSGGKSTAENQPSNAILRTAVQPWNSDKDPMTVTHPQHVAAMTVTRSSEMIPMTIE